MKNQKQTTRKIVGVLNNIEEEGGRLLRPKYKGQ